MSNHKPNIKFYQNLAKVFYAVAKAEKNLSNRELEFLKNIVKKEWLQIDEIIDGFGIDTAYQMEIIFDWLHDKKATSEDCFEDFIEYYHNHLFLFTTEIKKIVMLTALKLSNSILNSKNSNKLLFIRLLQIEFNKEVSKYDNH